MTAHGLAPYACWPQQTRGRRYPQAPAPTRNEHERDRDRIVHCTSFRRLVYKTQVFLNHEGDLFRTRMTHSLEVAQLGRSMARVLRLNEDLVEAIALAHDLGHTPFGHAGQDALSECMRDHGGFEHNLQSLRVVDHLELRYADFSGLNLCYETREGILKHCSIANARQLQTREPNGVGARFLNRTQPSLEAQLCNLADEIAYNAHDIDDGVRSGLLRLEQLSQVDLFERHAQVVRQQHPQLDDKRLLYETIRAMLSAQVYDLVATTQAAVDASGVRHVDEVRQKPALVGFSQPMRQASQALKHFLFDNLYRHEQVAKTMDWAKQVVCDLFSHYRTQPQAMGDGYAERADLERAVADYIAGMTDRFAAHEHASLSGQSLPPTPVAADYARN